LPPLKTGENSEGNLAESTQSKRQATLQIETADGQPNCDLADQLRATAVPNRSKVTPVRRIIRLAQSYATGETQLSSSESRRLRNGLGSRRGRDRLQIRAHQLTS
jgi:hypothetical protein